VSIPRWKPTNQSFETFRDYIWAFLILIIS
jgi:hypothetical protein